MSQNYADALQAMVRFTGIRFQDLGDVVLTPWDAELTQFPPTQPPGGTIGAQRGVRRVTQVAVGTYDVMLDTELATSGPAAGFFDAYARTIANPDFPPARQLNVVVSDTLDLAVKRVVVTNTVDNPQEPLDDQFVLDLKFWKYPAAGPG